MASEKILLVDDDVDLLEVLSLYLEKNGYKVYTASDGVQAMSSVTEVVPDIILLDVVMPNLDGFEFLQMLRKKTNIPAIILSSKDDDMDKILGLGIGADDFLSKSTSMPVILAKIRAQLRRSRLDTNTISEQTTKESVLKFPGLVINLDSADVLVDSKKVKLSAKEYQLLSLLARHPERVYTVEKLFELIWGENSLGDSRTVMVHLSNLRKKIEINPDEPKYIETLRGIGYKFKKPKSLSSS